MLADCYQVSFFKSVYTYVPLLPRPLTVTTFLHDVFHTHVTANISIKYYL